MEEREIKVSPSPLAPSVSVKGGILGKWEDMGGSGSALGYPLFGEQNYYGAAKWQKFQRGVMVSHPTHGTHAVTGRFYLIWADALGMNGTLKYPLTDAVVENGVTVQKFLGGELRSDMDAIKNGIDLRGEFARRGIDIRNQGQRGTCSSQTMVAAMEFLYSGLLGWNYRHLSVEYISHFANVATGDRSDSHCFIDIAAGYEKYGIIPDSLWPYNKDWKYDYDEAQRFVTADMINTGRLLLAPGLKLNGRFIKEIDGHIGLTPDQFEQLLAQLDSGVPACVGRDHSLTAVAYRFDAAAPGGGFMWFRNSYGTTADFTGYQVESFENVKKTVNDIYVYNY